MNQGYMQQKRISGREATYKWQDPQPSPARDQKRKAARLNREGVTVSVDNRQGKGRAGASQPRHISREEQYINKKREELKSTLAMCIVLVFVVCGVFAVIGRLSQVSAQSKYNDYLSKEIISLENTIESKQQELEHERSDAVIRSKAEQLLGMAMPRENEVAYLRTVTRYTNAKLQTAEGSLRSR